MVVQKDIQLPEFQGHAADQNDLIIAKIEDLRKTHPLWDQFSPEWSFYLSAYEGGSDFATAENIHKHPREHEDDFNDRVKRVHNLNYCEPLVEFFTSFIFSESIDRNGGSNSDFYLKFIKNVNRRGDSIDDFMRQVSDDVQIFGMSYVLVDTPPKPAGKPIVTKADEERLDLRPYWVLVKPDEVIDWVVDDFGRYQYIKRRQIVDEVFAGSRRVIEKYTEITPELYTISRIDVTKSGSPAWLGEESIPNQLGEIPIVVSKFRRSKKYPSMGLSFLRDFAYNNREVMNLTSLLQEFLYRQAFNILAIQRDEVLPTNEPDEGIIGSSNVLEFPKGASAPQYISPPVDPAKEIAGERARMINEMFKRAAQDFVGEIFNGEKASGFSQAQSFSKTVPHISSRADCLERVENELMALTLKMMGKNWDGKIKYKDRYELTNLNDALTQLQILVKDLQIPSETFIREELKRAVREYDGKLPKDILAKVEKEIDNADMSGWKKTQKEALVGKQGTSPAAQQKPKSTGTMEEAEAEAKVKTAATTKLKAA
jgi:hypothetical protein